MAEYFFESKILLETSIDKFEKADMKAKEPVLYTRIFACFDNTGNDRRILFFFHPARSY